jgi:hypothetical protein
MSERTKALQQCRAFLFAQTVRSEPFEKLRTGFGAQRQSRRVLSVIPCVTAMDGRNADFAGAKICRLAMDGRSPGNAGAVSGKGWGERATFSISVIPAEAGIHLVFVIPTEVGIQSKGAASPRPCYCGFPHPRAGCPVRMSAVMFQLFLASEGKMGTLPF